VLEAMAYGVPVVASTPGAEGLEWDREAPVALADRDEDIAAAGVALIRDCERRRAIARAGRACVARSFSPSAVAPQLVRELYKLVAAE
jgi:glycosyltransferase involved in cell wall biosynthesis